MPRFECTSLRYVNPIVNADFDVCRSPVPRGNRQFDVVWAEITEAGREWLKAQAEP